MPEHESYSQDGPVEPVAERMTYPEPASTWLAAAKIPNPRRFVIPTGPETAPGDVYHGVKVNTDPPGVRCGMCGGRCRAEGTRAVPFRVRARWITCRAGCCWSSLDPRRVGLRWRLRVLIGR